MAIRIECALPSFKDLWLDFRDKPWKFGDRRRIIAAGGDPEALALILPYIVAWKMKDAAGNEIALTQKVEELDQVEDAVAIWIIRSWFEARVKAVELAPN